MENTQQEQETVTFTGTYSPEDNKLRLYASDRLDTELYTRVRGAGFIWAPKQELFVAPMWTPSRADLVMELAGFIDDEETTLEERAAIRAERFEGYQANRAKDAESALNEYEALKDGDNVIAASDNWRSQRKAHKKAEKIERAGQRAVDMWETSEYWEYRTRGVLSHAAGRNNTRTLLNRIKKLTASKRKCLKESKEAEDWIARWTDESKELTQDRAIALAGYYRGNCYDRLKNEEITPEEARDINIKGYQSTIAHYTRWANHYENRLNYENAILKASGYVEPEKAKRPAQPKLLNYKIESVEVQDRWGGGTEILKQVEMTKAEYKRIYCDNKATKLINDDHRVRFASIYDPEDTTRTGYMRKTMRVIVFITDSKEHKKP